MQRRTFLLADVPQAVQARLSNSDCALKLAMEISGPETRRFGGCLTRKENIYASLLQVKANKIGSALPTGIPAEAFYSTLSCLILNPGCEMSLLA